MGEWIGGRAGKGKGYATEPASDLTRSKAFGDRG